MGDGKDGLWGNLYQQDNYCFVEYVGCIVFFYIDVMVIFIGGKEVWLLEKEFYYEKVVSLKYLYGSIKEVCNEVEDEIVVQGVVKWEYDCWWEMFRGYFVVYL